MLEKREGVVGTPRKGEGGRFDGESECDKVASLATVFRKTKGKLMGREAA